LTDLFDANTEQDLSDVEVVTLTQWAEDKAYDEAWKIPGIQPTDIEDAARHIMAHKFLEACEFVKITSESIQVGVHQPEVDHRAIYKALSMLAKVDNLTDPRKYEFGKKHLTHEPT